MWPGFPQHLPRKRRKRAVEGAAGIFRLGIERLLDAPPGGKGKALVFASDQDDTERAKRLVEVEVADLTEALAKGNLSEEKRTQVVADYRQCRMRLSQTGDDRATEAKRADALALPEGLPEEFRLYFLGAQAYHRKGFDEACDQWKALLDLPLEQRHYRCVWAAFMMGEAVARGAHEEAYGTEMIAWERARQFAAEGASDQLNLAAESLGSQAKTYLEHRDYAAAITRYLEQAQAGDFSAVQSLRATAREILTSAKADEFYQVIRVPRAREVISAYLIGEADRREAGVPPTTWPRWLAALEKAGVTQAPEADRLAWLAYQGGFFDLAERWSARAPEDAVMAKWVKAKLALRHGKIDTAADALVEALNGLEPLPAHLQTTPLRDERPAPIDRVQIDSAWAELGTLRMLQRRYEDALDAFVNGGHWEDSAYIAERVLNVSELEGWVLVHTPNEEPAGARKDATDSGFGRHRGEDLKLDLRFLLARRLVRGRQFESAETFFPETLKSHYSRYRAAVKEGFDSSQAPDKRARAFWDAAQLAREEGLELMGTELEPDNHIWSGQYGGEGRSLAAMRAETLHFMGGPFQPTDDELARVAEHAVPERRFHYRWRAAELAWWAAALLPNESEETATILHTAGTWLKARDPQEADRFYQALVIRCGRTELGKKVAERHWFWIRKRPSRHAKKNDPCHNAAK